MTNLDLKKIEKRFKKHIEEIGDIRQVCENCSYPIDYSDVWSFIKSVYAHAYKRGREDEKFNWSHTATGWTAGKPISYGKNVIGGCGE